jgi:hypothetical protein
METRNSKLLASFIAYCQAYPTLRFWQALRGWSRLGYILAADTKPFPLPDGMQDTFYWEGKDG